MAAKAIQTRVSKLRKTLTVWGISSSMILAGVAFGMRTTKEKVVEPYIRSIVKCQFDTLHGPFSTRLDDVSYDSRLIRNIMELSVPDSVVFKAKKKTDEAVWKVK